MEDQDNVYENEETSFEIESDENLEVEVVDDTPEEDRDRGTVEDVADPDEDEVRNYSTNVQNRIKELTHARHDERRAKEAALREREEAINLAKQALEQNKALKQRLQNGEQAFMENAKQRIQYEYEIAKRKLLEAKSVGDIEAEIAAQEEFNKAQLTKVQIESYQPSALQNDFNDVNIEQVADEVTNRPPKVDQKAVAWKERNPWFWVDRAMTGAALGTHEELVESGYDPQSDEYYRELDSRMRQMFPHKFQQEPARQQNKRPATVVASAARSNPSKKVTLSSSEVALARRLNLPIEVYAKQKLELEKRNG